MNSNSSANNKIPHSVQLSHRVVLFTFYGLLLTFTVKAILSVVSGSSFIAMLVVLIIQCLPLLIFIPGMRAGHLRTYAWLSFVSLIYFIPAVLTAFTPESFYYGLWLALLCTGLFAGLVAYINLARKHLGQVLGTAK